MDTKLTSKVQSEVNHELSKSQRDYYLREQMRAIQRELGEASERGEELDELRDKIDETQLPQEALKEVNREFDRLRRMSPGSPMPRPCTGISSGNSFNIRRADSRESSPYFLLNEPPRPKPSNPISAIVFALNLRKSSN